MKRYLSYLLFFSCLMMLTPLYAGTQTLSTYYPAPQGDYLNMTINQLLTMGPYAGYACPPTPYVAPLNAYIVNISGVLTICDTNGAYSLTANDLWTGNGTTLRPVFTTTNPVGENVGIGLANVDSQTGISGWPTHYDTLEVNGAVAFGAANIDQTGYPIISGLMTNLGGDGLLVGWNRSAHLGDSSFINFSGAAPGGFGFYVANLSTTLPVLTMRSSGNVGIGVSDGSTPGNALDVENGNIDASGYIQAGGTGGGGILFSGTTVPTAGVGSSGLSFYGRPRIGDWGQSLTIGEPNGTNGGMILQVYGAAPGAIYTGISTGITVAPTYHNTLDNGYGNVGINNSSPGRKLSIVTSSSDNLDGIHLQAGGTTKWLDVVPNLSAFNWNGLVQAGDMGIIYTNGTSGTGSLVIGPWSTGPAEGIRLDSSGNVTIGGNLTVTGNILSDLCITGTTCSSDIRLKQNITPLTDTLSKIDQLRGVSFEWNHLSASMGHKEGQKSIGMIAQEMQKVYPELVTSFKKDKTEYLAIDYAKFTAVLLQSVKDLKSQMNTMQEQINTLQDKVKVLEKQK